MGPKSWMRAGEAMEPRSDRTCQLVSRETPVTMRRMPGGRRVRGLEY